MFMSLLGKPWRILNPDPNLTLLDQLLENRNIKDPEAKSRFLNLQDRSFHDPNLMPGVKTAVQRITKAINNQEKIIIFGDYDVDGITGTAILYLLLSELGAKVSYRLPHRIKDGYGLNMRFVEEFIDKKIDLVVTVDCGISCAPEVEAAAKGGVDMIISDHHHIPDKLPNKAIAIIHPKLANSDYPDRELTGSAVAFKLASALINELIPEAERAEKVLQYVDLAALGTVADCAPLLDENRLIVSRGLDQLSTNAIWPGLQALKDIAQVNGNEPLTTYHIGFVLGPRINAVGRISDPYFALQMLIQSGDKAYDLARKLDMVNRERQDLTAAAVEEAELKLQPKIKTEKILLASSPDWHAGILGLIAGRLTNKHSLPAVIMQEQADKIVGSCRGPEGFDFAKTLNAHAHLLDRFGGHKQAAGFSLKKENLATFINALETYAHESKWDQDFRDEIVIDTTLPLTDLSIETYNKLNRLRPFGIGNDEPVFCIKNVQLDSIKAVGKLKNHLSAKLKTGNQEFGLIGFNLAKAANNLGPYSKVDLACRLTVNRFRNKESLQLQVVDIRDAN